MEGATVADTRQGSTSELVRFLAGFAALGSGLTFFALSADVLLVADGIIDTALGSVVGLWATVLTGWGILALRVQPDRNRAAALLARTVPRVLPGAAAVVLAALVWSALPAPAGGSSFDVTLASALALVLLQLGCHGVLRRRADRASSGTRFSPGGLLAGLSLSAVLVAAIATPGLAASTAGDHAVPHGGHGSEHAPGHTGH